VEKEELEKRIKDLPFQQDELVALRAENERLTRERDEASTNLTTARLSNAMLAEELAELKAIMAEKRQGWKASRRLQAERDEALNELARVRGAMRADDARLLDAGKRVGIMAGCDTPDDMAEEILRLRTELARVREELAAIRAAREHTSAITGVDMPSAQDIAAKLVEQEAEIARVRGYLCAALLRTSPMAAYDPTPENVNIRDCVSEETIT
jgi:myosin heavy subunit